MTTRHPEAADEKSRERFVLPDHPEGEPEDMTSFDHLTLSGSAHHLDNPGTTVVVGERYLTRALGAPASERMAPDLLIAFNVEPETYRENNGYIISEQGKPPDFVLEIASRSTGQHDMVDKRPAYADLGIPEYWRFDETGESHGTHLAGDRLVDGGYEPVPSRPSGKVSCRDTAPCSTSSSGGTTDSWAGTTGRPGNTLLRSHRNGPGPKEKEPAQKKPRPGSENWRLNWSGAGRADHSGPVVPRTPSPGTRVPARNRVRSGLQPRSSTPIYPVRAFHPSPGNPGRSPGDLDRRALPPGGDEEGRRAGHHSHGPNPQIGQGRLGEARPAAPAGMFPRHRTGPKTERHQPGDRRRCLSLLHSRAKCQWRRHPHRTTTLTHWKQPRYPSQR